MTKKARVIAHYLPQFYPIPENDEWWGEGFTEWTNVKKAVPLFPGHKQPVIPGELGYYDLRDPEVREKQAQLARDHGIEGFCYWHYWFGNGKRILERVFDEVLASGKPDFPFCLAWANETWTGIWHGAKDRILIEQKYPGEQDYIEHFKYLNRAFHNNRYIKVNGKPIFVIYRPQEIPDLAKFVNIFKAEAERSGLPGLYLVGNNVPDNWNPNLYGFDAVSPPSLHLLKNRGSTIAYKISRASEKFFSKSLEFLFFKRPMIFPYTKYIKKTFKCQKRNYRFLPSIIPNWDNTPRSGKAGWILINSSPSLFRKVLKKGVELVQEYPLEERIIFLKSWNEWAEGNYVEPDLLNGTAYLKSCKSEILV